MALTPLSNLSPQVEAAEMLYRFALDCAEHKVRNTCTFECQNCASNIKMYGLNDREALLINHTAELEMRNRLDVQQNKRLMDLAYTERVQESINRGKLMSYSFLALFIAFILFAVWLFRWTPPHKAPEQEAEGYAVNVAYIVETLTRIYEVDMNHDGKFNCIDRAIQFYNAYPIRDDVRIVVNHNEHTGLNHLFVFVAGKAIEPAAFLEPQYVNGDGLAVGVADYWGDQYDPAYDRDVTDYWELIRVNKYRW
jgi:hypothetical protein